MFRLFLIVSLAGIFVPAYGNISLPEIFSDNMVLQQQSDVTLWGWAKSGETVTVNAGWSDYNTHVRVGNQGTWKVTLKTPKAGGPYEINLKGYNEITIKNVMIGEVWLCSGQSNMELSSSGINNGREEVANANYPDIRLYQVSYSSSHYPQDQCTGAWTECTSETMKNFSAIAYLFGRKLHEALKVPIGLINSSWGGTPAEAWIPEDVIQNNDFLKVAAAKQKPVPWGPVEPGRIYNAMIHPLIPFRIAGTLWYQGEANTVNAYAYQKLLSALITSWRSNWGYDFPFYFVQIAPYKYGNNFDGVTVRDEQRRTLDVPNTGMVVISDIGDTTNIHPRDKQDVALRLANMALNRYYKTIQVEDSGPLFKTMEIDKDKAIISFDHAEGLHVTGKKGEKPDYFEIAGADKVFYPAEAKIKDDQVIVQSKKVKVPVAVRYAWRNTATPNLFNGAGLPASCFTTEPVGN